MFLAHDKNNLITSMIRSRIVCTEIQNDNQYLIMKKRNQKEISTPNTEVGKTKLTIRYLYLENIS